MHLHRVYQFNVTYNSISPFYIGLILALCLCGVKVKLDYLGNLFYRKTQMK